MTMTIPIRTHNPLNNRRHWRTVWRRGREQKQAATMHLVVARPLPRLPVTVGLTRIGKRAMDGDGLAASLKHVRDAVAAQYGIDDADPRLRWSYGQETGKDYAVRIEITPS